jgi:hypothetical protein
MRITALGGWLPGAPMAWVDVDGADGADADGPWGAGSSAATGAGWAAMGAGLNSSQHSRTAARPMAPMAMRAAWEFCLGSGSPSSSSCTGLRPDTEVRAPDTLARWDPDDRGGTPDRPDSDARPALRSSVMERKAMKGGASVKTAVARPGGGWWRTVAETGRRAPTGQSAIEQRPSRRDSRHAAQYFRLLLVVIGLAGALRGAEPPSEQPLIIALPQTLEIRQLVEIVARFAKQSVQYNPQKITGAVNLAVQGEVTQAQLWDIFNQVLVGQGFTCILAGDPPSTTWCPSPRRRRSARSSPWRSCRSAPLPPGYGSAIVPLHDLARRGGEGPVGVVRQPDPHPGRARGVVVSAPLVSLREVQRILVLLDRPGMSPGRSRLAFPGCRAPTFSSWLE